MKYISFLVSPRTVFWVIVIEVIIWSNIDLINSRLLARMCTILKWAWFLLPTLYQIICVQESLGLIFQKKQEFYICTFYGLTESSSKISGKHHKTFSTSRASSHSFFWILPTRFRWWWGPTPWPPSNHRVSSWRSWLELIPIGRSPPKTPVLLLRLWGGARERSLARVRDLEVEKGGEGSFFKRKAKPEREREVFLVTVVILLWKKEELEEREQTVGEDAIVGEIRKGIEKKCECTH